VSVCSENPAGEQEPVEEESPAYGRRLPKTFDADSFDEWHINFEVESRDEQSQS